MKTKNPNFPQIPHTRTLLSLHSMRDNCACDWHRDKDKQRHTQVNKGMTTINDQRFETSANNGANTWQKFTPYALIARNFGRSSIHRIIQTNGQIFFGSCPTTPKHLTKSAFTTVWAICRKRNVETDIDINSVKHMVIVFAVIHTYRHSDTERDRQMDIPTDR